MWQRGKNAYCELILSILFSMQDYLTRLWTCEWTLVRRTGPSLSPGYLSLSTQPLLRKKNPQFDPMKKKKKSGKLSEIFLARKFLCVSFFESMKGCVELLFLRSEILYNSFRPYVTMVVYIQVTKPGYFNF